MPCTCYGPHHRLGCTLHSSSSCSGDTAVRPERADKLLSLPNLGDGSAVDLMDDMQSLLGSDEGGFLLPQPFLHRLPPPVCTALVNSPCLAVGDFHGLAKEADCVLVTSRHFSIYRVALDTLQPAADKEDLLMGARVFARRRWGDLYFFLCGRKAWCNIFLCILEVRENAKVSAQ